MDDFNDIKIESGDLSSEESPSQKSLGGFGHIFIKMTSDMKFVGIFTIIYGALSCLSIIGAVIGIPIIIAGLRLREAADEYQLFQSTSNNQALRRAFEKQQRYFGIQKILIIIGLVMSVLGILAVIFLNVFLISSMSGYDNF